MQTGEKRREGLLQSSLVVAAIRQSLSKAERTREINFESLAGELGRSRGTKLGSGMR